MINTVTLNPALDYFVELPALIHGKTNRTNRTSVASGGKGINVSIMSETLGMKSRATGFLAGFTGEEISRRLCEANIEDHFVQTGGMTRINIKIKEHLCAGSLCETEINGDGPDILPAHIESLFDVIDDFPSHDFLVLSGSIPRALSYDFYAQMMDLFRHKYFQIVLDTSGKGLERALSFEPFLIKPNRSELEELFEIRFSSQDDMISCCKELQYRGAKNILLSLGADGAILLDESGRIHRQKAPAGTVVASSGAGDSMVAGFLKGYMEKDMSHALRLSVAAGSATAFSAGIANKEAVYKIFEENRR